MRLAAVFATGLVAGGLSCAGSQAGFLVSAMARSRPATSDATSPPATASSWRAGLLPVGGFLGGKLASHSLAGALLGAAGGGLPLGPRARGSIQLAAGLFLLVVAIEQLFGVRGLLPSLPSSWTRVVRRSGRLAPALAPAAIGASTLLVPCGVTLSVAFLALAAGSPLPGAAVMAVFVLGTVPIFTVIGLATRSATRSGRSGWRRLTGLAVAVSAVIAVNGALTQLQVPYAPSRLWADWRGDASVVGPEPADVESGQPTPVTIGGDGVQRAMILATDDGYSPTSVRLIAGLPTVLRFKGAGFSCANVIVVPSVGAEVFVEDGQTVDVELGVVEAGTQIWHCGMGMYLGVMNVVPA